MKKKKEECKISSYLWRAHESEWCVCLQRALLFSKSHIVHTMSKVNHDHFIFFSFHIRECRCVFPFVSSFFNFMMSSRWHPLFIRIIYLKLGVPSIHLTLTLNIWYHCCGIYILCAQAKSIIVSAFSTSMMSPIWVIDTQKRRRGRHQTQCTVTTVFYVHVEILSAQLISTTSSEELENLSSHPPPQRNNWEANIRTPIKFFLSLHRPRHDGRRWDLQPKPPAPFDHG